MMADEIRDSLGRPSQGPMFFSKKMVGDMKPKYLEDEKQDWGRGRFEGTCSFTCKTRSKCRFGALPKTR